MRLDDLSPGYKIDLPNNFNIDQFLTDAFKGEGLFSGWHFEREDGIHFCGFMRNHGPIIKTLLIFSNDRKSIKVCPMDGVDQMLNGISQEEIAKRIYDYVNGVALYQTTPTLKVIEHI